MRCPLFIMNDVRAQLGKETERGECLKEECAWWIRIDEACSIAVLAHQSRLQSIVQQELIHAINKGGER